MEKLNVILDTTVLRQDVKLRSRKTEALFALIERAQGALILPEVVFREALAHYRRDLAELLGHARTAAEQLSNKSLVGASMPPLRVDIESELARYQELLLGPRNGIRAILLRNHAEEDLPELVARLVERRKPASQAGREARDVLIWLAVKRHALESLAGTVFISANVGDFAGSDGRLAPELCAELGDAAARFRYHPTIDAFLKSEGGSSEYVSRGWIEEKLRTIDVSDFVLRALERGATRLRNSLRVAHPQLDREEMTIEQVDVRLSDYFVYRTKPGVLYLNLSYSGSLACRVDATADRVAGQRGPGQHVIRAAIELSLSAAVAEGRVAELEVDDWYLS